MKGHIRRRGERSWEIKFDTGADPLTGRRRIRYLSFKGTKREAQVKLAELIAAVGRGSYVEPSKTTVADFVRARVDQWEAAGDISARTAQRYRQLVENQIAPHPITRRISWEDDRDSPTLLAQGRPVNGSQSRSHSLKRGANRAYVLARLRRDGRADLVEQVETGSLSVRRALALITAHNPTSQRPPNGGAT
jgi:hypothetical protein